MCLSPASSLYKQELDAEILYPVGKTEKTPDPLTLTLTLTLTALHLAPI